MRVLIVEDHAKLAGLLRGGFEKDGFVADVISRGEDALWMAGTTRFDVLILDVMLPGIDGFETCRRLRADGVSSPILMLTARAGIGDRVSGLNEGADDYLIKPFSFAELLARVRALARRPPVQRPKVLQVDDLRLDPAGLRAWRGQTELSLSTKELLLLEAFMTRPGEVLSRLDLLESAWDHAYENRSNVIDAYVRRLREKIDRPFGRRTLETVRGSGYRLHTHAHTQT
ncbi:MAG TPA: response regulator transcription factor [Solirubrobacteraceae bacterium]|jgi:two-component system OmpR family response regulator|nr:response regulator transcription factor [Solirubrobacteraceae bacterium]